MVYLSDWPPITQPECPQEAESKEKHGVWDPIPEMTITSPFVHSRVDSNTFFMGNPMPESTLTLYAKVDFIPQSGTLDMASDYDTSLLLFLLSRYWFVNHFNQISPNGNCILKTVMPKNFSFISWS
jgi:hypothetical protein